MCQTGSGVRQAVEIILALTARGDDSAVPQERQVMADRGLALAQLGAQSTHVPLSFGKNQDHLKSRRVADVLEQDRCSTSLMVSLLGPTNRLGLARGRLRGGGALYAGLGC